jgi:hypothetical protein
MSDKSVDRRDEFNSPVGISRNSKVRTLFGCSFSNINDYLREFEFAVEPNALPTVLRIQRNFAVGNKVDFRSFFDILIDKSVTDGGDYIPRVAATTLVDHLLNKNPLFNTNSTFKEFELDNRKKIGPYSIRLPFSEVVERGPCEYFSPQALLSYSRPILDSAFDCVRAILPENSLKAVSLIDAYNNADKTTNWGSPLFCKGNDVFEGRLASETYFDIASKDFENKALTWYPCTMFMRTQPSGTNIPKQRIAFGAPHSVTLLESTLQIPLLNALKYLPEFTENLSIESTDGYVSNLFRECKDSNINIIGFDASGYDKSLSKDLLYGVYNIIEGWFSNDDKWLVSQVRDYMVHSDLITPIGVFRGRNKAVASGMAFTNMVDSLCQYVLHEYVRIKLGVDKCPTPTFQGDDGIWAIPGLDGSILAQIMSEFAIVVNPEKVSVSQYYVTFCQRLYMSDYFIGGVNVGIRSAYRTINSIISFERRRKEGWKGVHDSVRVIMQLIGLQNNPIHKLLVLYLCDCDLKYGLGSTHPGGIGGMFKEAGEFDNVIRLAGGSSWERARFVKVTRNLYSLLTIKIIMSRLADRIA